MRTTSFIIPAMLVIGASADRLLPRNAAIPLAALERRATTTAEAAVETKMSIQTISNELANIPASTNAGEVAAASATPAAGDINNAESKATCEAKGLWLP